MITVFLADDEYLVRTSLKNNIPWQENGFEVVGEANNGRDAYEKILNLNPDLAIIDINMPGLDGLELIGRLREAPGPDCEYIILTGYDEFKYAQKAVRLGIHDYVLKPIDYDLFVASLNKLGQKIRQKELLAVKLQNLEKENEQFILDNYYNDLVNCNLAAYGMDRYDGKLAQKILLPYESFSVLLCDMEKPAGSLQEIRKTVTARLSSFSFVCCIDYKKRLFFITDSHDAQAFQEFVRRVSLLLKTLCEDVVTGIGLPYPSFDQIYLSYNEACIALKNSGLTDEKTLYYEMFKDAEISLPLNGRTRNLLKAHILNADLPRVESSIREFYTELRSGRVTFNVVILQTFELLNLLTEVLSAYSPLPISVLNLHENIFDRLSGMADIGRIEQWVLSIYKKSITRIVLEASPVSDITKQIESYIERHYMEPDLSIPQISEELYLNYSYICYCFKRDKNVTINDYINQYRIDKALEYFQNHVDNVSFVAEKTGFNNASYFSKKFKKHVGLSPSEYMRTVT